jgi:hypothetical protein
MLQALDSEARGNACVLLSHRISHVGNTLLSCFAICVAAALDEPYAEPPGAFLLNAAMLLCQATSQSALFCPPFPYLQQLVLVRSGGVKEGTYRHDDLAAICQILLLITGVQQLQERHRRVPNARAVHLGRYQSAEMLRTDCGIEIQPGSVRHSLRFASLCRRHPTHLERVIPILHVVRQLLLAPLVQRSQRARRLDLRAADAGIADEKVQEPGVVLDHRYGALQTDLAGDIAVQRDHHGRFSNLCRRLLQHVEAPAEDVHTLRPGPNQRFSHHEPDAYIAAT